MAYLKLQDDQGRSIRVIVLNESEDGTGTWHVPLVDSSGNLKAVLVAGAAAIGKLAANSGVDIGDVDVLSIAAGTNLIGKVSIDQVTANANEVVLKAGTAAIGKLVANTGVDIGDVDVTSVPAPLNVTGGGVELGALRVTLANDSTGVVSVDDNAGSLTVDVGTALPAGTNAIGKLAANSGVDIGDVDILSIAAGTNQIGARSKAALLSSGVKAADASIKGSAGEVYWITICDTAALSVELNDSTAGAGTDQWAMVIPANGYAHFIFDPPLEFATGIYLDVSTGTCKVTIGYK